MWSSTIFLARVEGDEPTGEKAIALDIRHGLRGILLLRGKRSIDYVEIHIVSVRLTAFCVHSFDLAKENQS